MQVVTEEGPSDWIHMLASYSGDSAGITELPWETTPLGGPDTWSDALLSAVRVCMSSSAPMLIGWGPDLIRIFNLPYVMLAGEKNLIGTFGIATSVAWSDTWDDVGPGLNAALLSRSDHVSFRRRFSDSDLDGAPETWLEYSCSHLGGLGTDCGVLFLATDVSDQVVSERHLICLRNLATGLLNTRDPTDVCVTAARILSDNTKSLPWAEFHLLEDAKLIRIASTLRKSPTPPSDHQMKVTLSRGRPRVVLQDPAVVDLRTEGQNGQKWSYLAPLGFDTVTGVFVAGLNPTRQSNTAYRAFVDLCWKAISVAIDSAAQRSRELQTQLRISTTLQEAMLSPATDLPTVAARYLPATGGLVVGGDWYDVIDLGGGLQAITVGDCVGHDLEAAAIMGQLRSASRALLIEGNGPSQVLHAMDLFVDVIDGLAATMVCAILDPGNRRITYSSAGHPPGLLLHGGESRWLNSATGTPLGIRVDQRQETSTGLADKDLVLFYSDGLIERRHEPLTCGLDRLRILSEQHWSDPVQVFADTVIREMTAGGRPDDIVMVAARTHID